MDRRPGFVGPLLLLAVGFILLFNNMGLLPWVIWGSLWRYWPVILILFGIEILARHAESGVMYLLAVLICILIIAGTFFMVSYGYPAPDTVGKDMKGAILNNSRLEDKNMDFANLDNADLSSSILDGADMNFARMENANFSNSSLNGANMNFAYMKNANFNKAGLKGANLNFAELKSADLSNAILDGANLNFANLEGANMTGAQLVGTNHKFARTSESTICPDSKYGPCW